MSTEYLHQPSDPEVAELVERLTASLNDLPNTLAACRAQLEQGCKLGDLRGITTAEYAALYELARGLCDRQAFHHALPIALQLTLHDPANGRYAFMAGACLQRLRQHHAAALMYALACDVDADDAAAPFRLGECLAAIDRIEEARYFLNRAIDLSYGKWRCRALQDMARHKLDDIAHRT
jgi:tetratricopeptide (TPR) repeat protein